MGLRVRRKGGQQEVYHKSSSRSSVALYSYDTNIAGQTCRIYRCYVTVRMQAKNPNVVFEKRGNIRANHPIRNFTDEQLDLPAGTLQALNKNLDHRAKGSESDPTHITVAGGFIERKPRKTLQSRKADGTFGAPEGASIPTKSKRFDSGDVSCLVMMVKNWDYDRRWLITIYRLVIISIITLSSSSSSSL